MATFNANNETVMAAAEGCARRLAEWFGSAEAAIAALQDDPSAMVEIAMADFIKTQRKLTERASMNQAATARAVLSVIA